MKRRWWLWILLPIACLIIVFGVSELTGASEVSIFGWAILGAFGIMTTIFYALFLALFGAAGALLVKVLLGIFISNGENLSITLGILGFCAILVGYILTLGQFAWSLFIVIAGFFMGCFAGAEHQRFFDLHKE